MPECAMQCALVNADITLPLQYWLRCLLPIVNVMDQQGSNTADMPSEHMTLLQ